MKEQLYLPASALIFVPITLFFGVVASFSVIAFCWSRPSWGGASRDCAPARKLRNRAGERAQKGGRE